MLNEGMMEEMLGSENLRSAWKVVKANKGSAGIDHIVVDEFLEHIRPHWDKLKGKIFEERYKPAPVKRVYIPKARKQYRPLGIPTVQDRFIQQAMLQVMRPKFDESFSAYSFGFRSGRSAHDAVKTAQSFVKEGKDWVVDIDLKSFFDEVNHDILMRKVSEKIPDKRILKLLGKYLRSGVFEEGKVTKSAKGVPQGGPLSPLLANVYLDTLDKELEQRNLSFCRYADDCNIYVRSKKSADRVFASITRWIEKNLKLPINLDKSDTGRPWDRQFLGYQQTQDGFLRPSPKAKDKYKAKVKSLFNGRVSLKTVQLRDEWLKFIRGWCNYFYLADERYWRRSLSGWTRRHIRKCFWLRWHSGKGRKRHLEELGVHPRTIKGTAKTGAAWPMAKHFAMQSALNNKRLKRYGFLAPSDFAAA